MPAQISNPMVESPATSVVLASMASHCRIESASSASDGFRGSRSAMGSGRPMDPSAERRESAARRRKFGAHMSIAGGCDRAVWAAHAVGFADRPALHQEQQPVAGRRPDRRPRRGVPLGPGRDGNRRPGGPYLLSDQPGQSRRRALGEVDRRDGRRGASGARRWGSPTW